MTHWTLQNPIPTSRNLNELVPFGTGLLAFGERGLVTTSPDGITWTPHASGTLENLASFVRMGPGFLALIPDIGNGDGRVMISDDGLNWSAIPHGPPANRIFTGLAWTGSQAVLSTQDGLYVSPDLETWDRVAGITESFYESVFWTGDRIIAFSRSGAMISEDGRTWTEKFVRDLDTWGKISWDGRSFSAVTYLGDSVALSPDGYHWTTTATGIGKPLGDIRHVGDLYFGMARETPFNTYATLYTSPDAKSWTQAMLPRVYGLRDLNRTAGRYVAVGDWGTILTSVDGKAWTQVAGGFANHLTASTWNGYRYVVMGPGRLQSDSCDIYTSVDAKAWEPAQCGDSAALEAVTWTGAGFVAVGWNGAVSRSPDGIHWTTSRSSLKGTYYGIAWTGEKLVAVGLHPRGGGGVAISSDGVSWTEKSVATNDRPLLGIAWTGTGLVAVGGESTPGSAHRGIILTSQDGDGWEMRDSSVPTLFEVIWTGRELAAAGGTDEYGIILTSMDGRAWSSLGTLETLGPIRSVARAGNEWIVAGGRLYGGIATTTDGRSWTSASLPGIAPLNGLIAQAGTVVAFGEEGSILTAGYTPSGLRSGRVEKPFAAKARFEGDRLRVELPGKAGPGTRISVMTLEGTEVRSWPISAGVERAGIDATGLPAGMYLVRGSGRGPKWALRAPRIPH